MLSLGTRSNIVFVISLCQLLEDFGICHRLSSPKIMCFIKIVLVVSRPVFILGAVLLNQVLESAPGFRTWWL